MRRWAALSPVSSDKSSALVPSMMTLSAAIASPGLTRMTSPTARLPAGTRVVARLSGKPAIKDAEAGKACCRRSRAEAALRRACSSK
ncbi:hypothetical protein D3C72_2161460 [compost metagenome]